MLGYNQGVLMAFNSIFGMLECKSHVHGCADALDENKSAGMDEATWKVLNQ